MPEKRSTPDAQWRPYVEKLGQHIANLREERGWSQLDLANIAGVSFGTVQRIETGKTEWRGQNSPPGNPTLHSLYAVAAALDLTPAKLIADIPVPDRTWTREQHAGLRPSRRKQRPPAASDRGGELGA